MGKIAIALVRFYQYFFRNLIRYNIPLLFFPSQCRFYPSCSEYAIEAIQKHGFRRGSLRGLIRILRCNPFTSY
ncbi:MAG: membrane protein insertion efficiency factor YidD, partial [Candidatus Taylorbacteria bacterium]|nr:membrane protein insertion efficiency factor YidD [Candidatus Taylorbacteria bacterium]